MISISKSVNFQIFYIKYFDEKKNKKTKIAQLFIRLKIFFSQTNYNVHVYLMFFKNNS